jgi:3-dehydroquinate dehydratase-2
MPLIYILNGPNLNLLGTREPEIYGSDTLKDVENLCRDTAKKHDMEVDCRQSNHEGVLVDWIQEAIHNADAVIINAAAYTHTSIAIHDALKMLSCPIIEVHFSDPEVREEFRHISYISPLATKIIKGLGKDGYVQAIDFIAEHINK